MEMQRFFQMTVVVCVIFALVGIEAQAMPLSVDIVDHDFTFDVPYYQNPAAGTVQSAVYDYNGAAMDSLSLTMNNLPETAVAGTHNAASYVYSGLLPQVPPNPPGIPGATPPTASPWLYPLFFTTQYGAKLEIQMDFDANDGPYTNPAGDKFDVSLTGHGGFLRITGWIGTQGWPTGILYPDPQPSGMPNDIVLLEIEFENVSLLARAGHPTADLIEGAGKVKTLLGWDVNALQQYPEFGEHDGVTFFKFILPDTQAALFPLPEGENYDPLEDYNWDTIYGRISGETGIGTPEPATLCMLALGGLVLIRRRRK